MIPKDDLRIDTFRNSGGATKTQFVRVIHLPTGIVVKGSGLISPEGDLERHLIKTLEELLLERAFLIEDATRSTPGSSSDDAPDGRDS